MNKDRAERAERITGYLALQLRVARRMAEITGAPLGEMALRHTNFHRRLGLGVWRDGPPAAGWAPYAAELEALVDLPAQVVWTVQTYRWAPDEILPHPGQFAFGCFAYEPRNDDGVLRIHFNNIDTDAEGGPLASAKVGRRREELTRLFAHVAKVNPPDTTIRGGSWLYHVEAYRRLFPPAYVASREPYARPISLRGTATWGQVIDSHERVRPDVRDAVQGNLARLDPEAPWRVFPLQMLAVEAPLSAFLAFYRL